MYSLSMIRELNSGTKGLRPKRIYSVDSALGGNNLTGKVVNITGLHKVKTIFCDSFSGTFGISKVTEIIGRFLNKGYKVYAGITGEGQFQLYYTIYVKR